MPSYTYFGLNVQDTVHPLHREFHCIQKGGRWKGSTGNWLGNGLLYHYKTAVKELWPEIVQHRWFDLFLKEWIEHTYIGVLGPKNSGKTCCAAVFHLIDYYCFPNNTTVLVCSTTREMLENRIWGEIKKYHKLAKQRVHWIPGFLIEGRQRIVTDDRDEFDEGRDFRNGLQGIPMKKGNQYVGIGDIIGIKNKRKRLCGDELQGLPKGFIDGTANFIEPGSDCRVTGMGNPAQTTDSLGILCEPAPELGGWESGLDQTPKTKTWATRFDNGICIQFPGSDSPNNDEPEQAAIQRGAPLYPFLMSRDQMAKDARTWGKTDWHFLMFNEGCMPRGQGTNRVLTRQLCIKNGAMEDPVWNSPDRTYITCLDAAYRAVGGDRCVLMRLAFGKEADGDIHLGEGLVAQGMIDREPETTKQRVILALLDTIIVPIKSNEFGDPEDQIVAFVKKQHETWGLPPNNFYFDAGMRTSLVSAFARLWSPMVNTLDFGGKPSDRQVSADIEIMCKDYYGKRVSEIWFNWRLAVESKQVRGMTDELVTEGCLREYKKTTSGTNKIDVETKEEMKQKSSRSPDLADCFCIGLWGAIEKGFLIKRSIPKDAIQTDGRWKDDIRRKAKKAWASGQLNYSV